jgi:hypothetical protein
MERKTLAWPPSLEKTGTVCTGDSRDEVVIAAGALIVVTWCSNDGHF